MKEKSLKKRPKICLSLNCKNIEEIEKEIETYRGYFDMVELRADFLSNIRDISKEEVRAYLDKIHELINDTDIILCLKGDSELSNKVSMYALGHVEYIDIDHKNKDLRELTLKAKSKNTKVIVSYHDEKKMLNELEIVQIYKALERAKADIIKLALTANKEEDMYTLLRGAGEYKQIKGSKKIIAIAMGEAGKASRVIAGDVKSVITYGSGTIPTAPGQIRVDELSGLLDKYYE